MTKRLLIMCLLVVVGRLSINGIVHHSFSDPMIIVQVRETFFQLHRSMIDDPLDPKLNQPGSSVKITAPSSAIDFVWTIPNTETDSVADEKLTPRRPAALPEDSF